MLTLKSKLTAIHGKMAKETDSKVNLRTLRLLDPDLRAEFELAQRVTID